MRDLLKKISGKQFVVVAVVFATLLCSYPYVFARFFPVPGLTAMIIVEFVVLFFVDQNTKTKQSLPKPLFSICVIQVFIFLLLFVCHLDTFYILRFSLFVFISYYSIYVINKVVGVVDFISINNIWLCIQAVFGFIAFFLILFNILPPIIEVYGDTFYKDNFYGLTTSNAVIGSFTRIAGYFDEPGALAQWGVYSLVLNKISPRYNRKIELLLIIGLTVTFSMAYFIQLVLYLLLFNYKHIKKLIPVLGLILIVVSTAVYTIPKDSDLYFLTLRRFEMSDGKLETNRDNYSLQAKQFFKESPIIGKGYSYLVENAEGFYDNPYETLATSGVLGTIALYLPLIVILLRYRKNGAWQAVIVLILGYLQRPFHIQYIHYMMIYLLFLSCYHINMRPGQLNNYAERITE